MGHFKNNLLQFLYAITNKSFHQLKCEQFFAAFSSPSLSTTDIYLQLDTLSNIVGHTICSLISHFIVNRYQWLTIEGYLIVDARWNDGVHDPAMVPSDMGF